MMNRLFDGAHETVLKIQRQLGRLNEVDKPFRKTTSAQTPSAEQIATFIETAFWASLRRNEGRPSQFRATLAGPDAFPAGTTQRFADTVVFDEQQIAKIAPAIPFGGSLGVVVEDEAFAIWGFVRVRRSPTVNAITVDVSEAGSVRVAVGPYTTYAILDARSNPVISGNPTTFPDYLERILQRTSPGNDVAEAQAMWRECIALGELVRMIAAAAHGGTILIVPHDDPLWEASLAFAHRFVEPDLTIRNMIRRDLEDMNREGEVLKTVSEAPLSDAEKNAILGGFASSQTPYVLRSIRLSASSIS